METAVKILEAQVSVLIYLIVAMGLCLFLLKDERIFLVKLSREPLSFFDLFNLHLVEARKPRKKIKEVLKYYVVSTHHCEVKDLIPIKSLYMSHPLLLRVRMTPHK